MKLYILLLAIFLLPSVNGDVLIEQVLYDADGADEGKEFIDIKNYGSETISVKNLTLQAGSSSLEIIWQGSTCDFCYLFPNETKRIMVESLHNTAGSIQLNDSIYQLDLLGYGDAFYYSGSPAIDVASGKSLLRINLTQDNSLDFISSDILNDTEDLLLAQIVVDNVAPVLHEAEVFTQGGSFFVDGNASDDNGISDILSYSYYLGDSLYQNDSSLAGIIPFNDGISELPITDPQSELSLAVIDSYGELSDFLLIPIFTSLFEINSIKPVSLVPGESGFLEIALSAGKDATYSISLGSLYGKMELDLNSNNAATLAKGANGTIQLPLNIPVGTPAGTYKGRLEIVVN